MPRDYTAAVSLAGEHWHASPMQLVWSSSDGLVRLHAWGQVAAVLTPLELSTAVLRLLDMRSRHLADVEDAAEEPLWDAEHPLRLKADDGGGGV